MAYEAAADTGFFWGGGGGGVLSVSGPIRTAGVGAVGFWPIRGGGEGSVGFWPDTNTGGGGGGGVWSRIGGSPGYSTVVEFMRAGIY